MIHRLLSRCPALFTLALVPALASQTPVALGDAARVANITSPAQSDTYFFSGTQGDTLRVVFSSQNSGYPSYSYYHQLELRQGTTVIGNVIAGLGTETVTLPNTGYYTLHVRAQNNQSTGWYGFKLDRVNDPVGADRMALDWNLEGSLTSAADFAVYQIRAVAGSQAQLTFTSENSGYPSYNYYHYAELLGDDGTQIAAVQGNGAAPITFTETGVYTLFVAAQNWQSTGWYAAALECQSWPVTACDDAAHSSNFGAGLAGTNGVPSLTTAAPPQLGAMLDVNVGSSATQPTTALLLIGLSSANDPLAGYGGTVLVANPTLHVLSGVAPSGSTLQFPIPNDALLLGLGFAAQSLVVDAGAVNGFAFSPGLLVLLGN